MFFENRNCLVSNFRWSIQCKRSRMTHRNNCRLDGPCHLRLHFAPHKSLHAESFQILFCSLSLCLRSADRVLNFPRQQRNASTRRANRQAAEQYYYFFRFKMASTAASAAPYIGRVHFCVPLDARWEMHCDALRLSTKGKTDERGKTSYTLELSAVVVPTAAFPGAPDAVAELRRRLLPRKPVAVRSTHNGALHLTLTCTGPAAANVELELIDRKYKVLEEAEAYTGLPLEAESRGVMRRALFAALRQMVLRGDVASGAELGAEVFGTGPRKGGMVPLLALYEASFGMRIEDGALAARIAAGDPATLATLRSVDAWGSKGVRMVGALADVLAREPLAPLLPAASLLPAAPLVVAAAEPLAVDDRRKRRRLVLPLATPEALEQDEHGPAAKRPGGVAVEILDGMQAGVSTAPAHAPAETTKMAGAPR